MTQAPHDPQWVNSKINWRSRIVRYGKIRADQITPHPLNPRKHPIEQRKAVQASFDVLGQIAPVVINQRNGYLLDGEERSWLAMAQGDETEVDAIWVDLTEDEHLLALTIFDRITYMANYDRDNVEELLSQIDTDNEDLQALLDQLAQENGIDLLDETPLDASPLDIKESYSILIEVTNEGDQLDLIERLTREGYKCRALIS